MKPSQQKDKYPIGSMAIHTWLNADLQIDGEDVAEKKSTTIFIDSARYEAMSERAWNYIHELGVSVDNVNIKIKDDRIRKCMPKHSLSL